jgi:hypothetical protein
MSRVRIWDVGNSKPVGESLIGHTKPITAVALAHLANRTLVVTGSKDGKAGVMGPEHQTAGG